MKVKIEVLKTKSGEIVATAYPFDDKANRDWKLKKWEKKTGERLQWQAGDDAEMTSA